jgi:Calcineurin-like phosphoesterase
LKIIVIGDVHAATKSYQKLIRKLPPGQRSIQIGDMGIGFPGAGLHKMSEDHKWFRGNHDNPEKCRRTTNYLGDWGYLEQDKLFWVAGGYSIDRAMRVVDVSWWADEELSYSELQKAIDTYKEVRPEFVLSHEAPSIAGKALLLGLVGPYFAEKLECSMSRTAEALQHMLDCHQPKEWVFGHYHIDKTFFVANCKTKFTCVGIMSQYELEVSSNTPISS